MSKTPANNILFCPSCGNKTEFRLPANDNRPRAICTVCQTIHYQNPLCVVGTIPIYQNKIVLCKRNIEPRLGKWTLPAGFMELNESIAEGAMRETQEEAGMPFTLGELFAMIDLPQAGQLHIFFLAKVTKAQFNFGAETAAVKLFQPTQIPWSKLSFRTIKQALEWYIQYQDGQQPSNKIYHSVIY